MSLFRIRHINFREHQRQDLVHTEAYTVTILVNGRFFVEQLSVVRRRPLCGRDIALTNLEDDATTLHFNVPYIYQGVVRTVDIIIRNEQGVAITAFLDVELVDETQKR